MFLAELEPGGAFEGFSLTTGNEVDTLWENAGIDVTTSLWIEENYDPIVALAALVGQTSSSGNCGEGCSFFETKGWIDNGVPAPDFLSAANLRWFDNSPPLTTSPEFPQAPIGSQIGSTHFDGASPTRGAWLVEAPEPAGALGVATALAWVAALASLRRRARP
jgi:hypothetical protein